jgi:hypothetical protein
MVKSCGLEMHRNVDVELREDLNNNQRQPASPNNV